MHCWFPYTSIFFFSSWRDIGHDVHVTKLLPGEVVMLHLCSTAAVKLMLVDNSGSPPTDGISPVSSAGSSVEISGNSHVTFAGTNSALQMMGIVWTLQR